MCSVMDEQEFSHPTKLDKYLKQKEHGHRYSRRRDGVGMGETREEAGNKGAGPPQQQRKAVEVFSGGAGTFTFVI